MTTDFIQHKEAAKQPKFFGITFKRHKPDTQAKDTLELTRNSPFVDGTQDIFDVLAQHNMGANVLKDKTVSILKKAQNTIENAEKKIAVQASRIKNLERLNTTDELTNLQNRAGFEILFKRELARAKRYHEHAGILVLIDIESFDGIQKNHGKKAAEASLKLISKILSDEIREMDAAARFSENEFVLLFSNTAADKVVDRVQKLAFRINNLSFIWKEQEINISASLGLRGYGPQDSFEALFKSNEKDNKAKK